VAAAGIARPRGFFDDLRAAGLDVVSELTWPDHHRFTARDVERMRAAVAGSGAHAVVTTEKDMVRLLPLRPLPFPLAWQGLDVRIEPAAAFEAWMAERLRQADGHAAERRGRLAG
jgi:tetraacyldisaccharide 4'-kinase